MRKFVFAAAALASLFVLPLVPALAADLAVKATPAAPAVVTTADPFTGFRLGGGIGWGFDESGYGAFDAISATTLSGLPQGVVATLYADLGTRFSGSLYAGIEANGSIGNLKGSASGGLASGLITQSSKLDEFATIKAQLGVFLLPNTLLYVSPGFAFGDPSATATLATLSSTSNPTKTGWTVGAGIEQAISDHWLLRAEWERIDLGKVSTTVGPATLDATFQADVFRLGASYKF